MFDINSLIGKRLIISLDMEFKQKVPTMKLIEYEVTHNNTIFKIKFKTLPKRGWFDENIKPAIQVIKGLVPASARAYIPATYEWEVALEFQVPLQSALESMGFVFMLKQTNPQFKQVEVPKDYADNFHYAPAAPQVESAATIAEQLSKYLGVTISTQDITELKKLYRAKAREYHPDYNGGDGTKMSELNRLWTLYNSSERVN